MSTHKRNTKGLKPAKKGEVRNPNGRPKGSVNSKTVIKKLLEMTAVSKVNGKMVPIEGLDGKQINFAEAVFTQVLAKALKGDISAANALFDRLEGKPKQTTDVNLPAGAVVTIGGQKVDDE